jgi:hypothetical protein
MVVRNLEFCGQLGLALEVVLHADLHASRPPLALLQNVPAVDVGRIPCGCVCQQCREGASACLQLQTEPPVRRTLYPISRYTLGNWQARS